ncbi:WG repeat-containing protein (plasmid) [Pedobacter sp. BS3]|uniref:WG repeat-containing protein n=1 Tax=Pedobacter sp. BS3 TaxID=2567937 RepID=UPI0011EE7820|nr:WG repeat-containing protein [Pedobacter sp. BS3]TZF86319.1 WG repeat-containing protein [Pedobacter sp. BS3]
MFRWCTKKKKIFRGGEAGGGYGRKAAVKQNGKWGYIDRDGKEIVPFQYDEANPFEGNGHNDKNDRAIVKLNGKWGIIDNTGKRITDIKYDTVKFVSAYGDAEAVLNGVKFKVDETGRTQIKKYSNYDYDNVFVYEFRNGYTPAQIRKYTDKEHNRFTEKIGLIAKDSTEAIPFGKYDDVGVENGAENKGIAWVKSNGKWGIINIATGKEIIPVKYNSISRFQDGIARVFNGKYGYIDKTGKEIIPIKYEDTRDFYKGTAIVKLNGNWGVIDRNDKIIIPMKYEYVDFIDEVSGLICVKLNGKYGYIDKTDRVVVPFIYVNLGSFHDGLATASRNGNQGYIDISGREVIPIQYLIAHSFENGRAKVVKMNGDEGYIDKSGYFTFTNKNELGPKTKDEPSKPNTSQPTDNNNRFQRRVCSVCHGTGKIQETYIGGKKVNGKTVFAGERLCPMCAGTGYN